jgi:hypothetical protein
LGFLFHPLTGAACSSILHVSATPADVDRLVAAITYEIELIAAAARARVEFEKVGISTLDITCVVLVRSFTISLDAHRLLAPSQNYVMSHLKKYPTYL